MKRSRKAPLVALLAAAIPGTAAADFLPGTWRARVDHGGGVYTLQLRCQSDTDCEMRMMDGSGKEQAQDEVLHFGRASRIEKLEPYRTALEYAFANQPQAASNPEFAAVQKLLRKAVSPKAELAACMGLDKQRPDHFVVCTIRGPTGKPPAVLLYSSLLGLCGQGFCKYLIYPMVKAEGNK